MITFLGVILLLVAIISLIIGKVSKANSKANELIKEHNSKYDNPRYHKEFRSEFANPIPGKFWVWGVLAIFVFLLNGLFFYADAGTAYAVQYPTGGDKIIKNQGLKVKFWGRTIPISYETSIKDIILRENEVLPETERGVYNRIAHEWEFSDAIKAKIATAVVVRVNIQDEEAFLQMADFNKSEGKLIYGRVLPAIDQAIKNTCKLMDAQDYIAGASSQFDMYFRDQLESGMYLVEEYVEEEEVPEIIGDSTTVRKLSPKNSKSKRKKWRILRDSKGNEMRDKSAESLKQYGISITLANVTSIDWEGKFDKRLELQKEQVAQTQLEKAEAEKEYFAAQKAIAKGEREKAETRVTLEKAQLQQTIAAETRAKAAKFKEQEEANLLAAASKQAKRIKVLADAESYKNARLVSAGLTPQERAEYALKEKTAIAREFSKMAAPSTVIMGGGKGGSATEALIQANMANQLINNK